MNDIDKVKNLIEVMQTYIEEKPVQWKDDVGCWVTISKTATPIFSTDVEWRVKPEEKPIPEVLYVLFFSLGNMLVYTSYIEAVDASNLHHLKIYSYRPQMIQP